MLPDEDLQRKNWLSVLAKAEETQLAEALDRLDQQSGFRWLRRGETGAVMVGGRMAGTGTAFNMGEMTVSRAAVQLDNGIVGMGYAAGRVPRKAETIARIDAQLQRNPAVAEEILAPLVRAQKGQKEESGRKAAATKVDFFTLVRGDNPK